MSAIFTISGGASRICLVESLSKKCWIPCFMPCISLGKSTDWAVSFVCDCRTYFVKSANCTKFLSLAKASSL